MINRLLPLLFLAQGISCLGQWDVPAPIVLDGTLEEQKQVTGLDAPTGDTHGTSMDVDRYGTLNLVIADGSSTFTTTLFPGISAYTPGLRLTLVSDTANTGASTLNVNGLGAVPIRKHLTQELDSADLMPGMPMDLIHDGSVFQVTNQVHPSCPSGFKPISRESCVENESHAEINWFAAGSTCAARGFRLCSFGEWMQACRMPNGILPTILNYEWVDSAANSTNLAKSMGLNEQTLLPDCNGGGHRIPTGTYRYRCCSSR